VGEWIKHIEKCNQYRRINGMHMQDMPGNEW